MSAGKSQVPVQFLLFLCSLCPGLRHHHILQAADADVLPTPEPIQGIFLPNGSRMVI